MHDNIQVMFRKILLSHVRAYLADRGWRPVSGPQASRLYFHGPTHEGGEPYELSIPDSESHPKFRSRVQNLVFCLAEIEDRQPIEVARDLLAQTSQSPATRSSEHIHHVRLVNSRTQPIRLQLLPGGEPLAIEPGEMVDLVACSSSPSGPRIDFGDDAIVVDGPEEIGLRVFQSSPSDASQAIQSLPSVVRQELDAVSFGLSEAGTRELEESLQPVFSRAAFLMGEMVTSPNPDLVRRQTAMLISGMAKRVSSFDQAAEVMWRIAARVLQQADLQLELFPAARRDLFQLAVADDEFAPDQLYGWFRRHAIDLRQLASATRGDGGSRTG